MRQCHHKQEINRINSILNISGDYNLMTRQTTIRTNYPDTGRVGAFAFLLRTASGFTLVEVMISAILVTICLSAVAAIVRVGTDLQVSDNNRRQARMILRSTFENEFGFRQYGTIPDSTVRDTIVDIDPGDGNVLKGELTKTTCSDSVSSVTGTRVPVKIITLSLKWNEPGADSNAAERSITLYKLLAAVQ
jgi:prepilin-type N-terminal cleavage/methylation domain-containing protein